MDSDWAPEKSTSGGRVMGLEPLFQLPSSTTLQGPALFAATILPPPPPRNIVEGSKNHMPLLALFLPLSSGGYESTHNKH